MTTTENQELDYGEILKKKLKTTTIARYKASHFYELRAQYSLYSIGLLSSYLIIINLLPLFIPTFLSEKFIAFFTISVSILMLVFSHFELSKDYKVVASRLHNCAKELRKLVDDLEKVLYLHKPSGEQKIKDLENISNEYNHILSKFQENHNEISFRLASLSLEPDKFKAYQKFFIHLKCFVMTRLLYIVLMILPFIIILLFLCFNIKL